MVGIKALILNEDNKILMLHLPKWSGIPAHWDFPGGRMDPGETMIQTLKRELKEEIGVNMASKPKQLSSFLTNITIPYNDTRLPLIFIVYKVKLPKNTLITLDPSTREDKYDWFSPSEAVKKMSTKFPKEFCKIVSQL